jgi:hypothetical protein
MHIFIILVMTAMSSFAATTSISFWAYDQYAYNSPYYSHYGVSNATNTITIASIDLNDRWWGFSTTLTSAYHVSPFIQSNEGTLGPLRSVGWNQYAFIFNESNKTSSILMDGNTIHSGTYVNSPELFYFGFHDYYGGAQETVIDDFQMRINGTLVYQQGFDGTVLPDGWYVSRQDGGTYIAYGDTTTVHSGTGSMALGATAGGNLFSSIAFDLTSVSDPTSVPEPGTVLPSMVLVCSGLYIRFIRRHRTPRRRGKIG